MENTKKHNDENEKDRIPGGACLGALETGRHCPHHLEDAVEALSVQLTQEEVQQLEEAYRPHPIIAFSQPHWAALAPKGISYGQNVKARSNRMYKGI